MLRHSTKSPLQALFISTRILKLSTTMFRGVTMNEKGWVRRPSSSSRRKSQSSQSSGHPQIAHPRITDRLPIAERQIYEANELSQALWENAKKFRAQIGAHLDHDEIGILRSPVIDIKPEADSEAEFLALAKTWFGILDKAFFFNLLSDKMKAPDPIVIFHNAVCKIDGQCHYLEEMSCISLNICQGYVKESKSSTAQLMIGTLLHEMVHAFFYIFSCKCTSCDAHANRKGGRGILSHGVHWCNSMYAIQSALTDQIKWTVDTGIAESVALEMNSSCWTPRSDQIERWNLDARVLAKATDQAKKSAVFEGLFACGSATK